MIVGGMGLLDEEGEEEQSSTHNVKLKKSKWVWAADYTWYCGLVVRFMSNDWINIFVLACVVCTQNMKLL